ncbi:hypothetical protein GCM10007415_34630 [Parapedobacter pyrenivorans]|uniref:Uncharacterized protein n=1 Tax=Parapedobacter pyrenivorans TaxID=1305674 RepID=A0A917HZL3_9SPHI|nr:hypothetical protein [Parapedobacter pyrenivorans]GGG96508.1 hypothetical protein GCM10007415_34630 [Parapedobacter pyrenivorans]
MELGFTQRDVSRILYPDSDNNLLGSIESSFRKNGFTDENLNKLARAFSKRARILGLDHMYTLEDFYPANAMDEILVPKKVIDIPKELKQTGMLHLLLVEKKEKFFKDWHTVSEIAAFCGKQADKVWTNNDFTAIVKVAVDEGKLIRKSEEEALFKRP